MDHGTCFMSWREEACGGHSLAPPPHLLLPLDAATKNIQDRAFRIAPGAAPQRTALGRREEGGWEDLQPAAGRPMPVLDHRSSTEFGTSAHALELPQHSQGGWDHLLLFPENLDLDLPLTSPRAFNSITFEHF